MIIIIIVIVKVNDFNPSFSPLLDDNSSFYSPILFGKISVVLQPFFYIDLEISG